MLFVIVKPWRVSEGPSTGIGWMNRVRLTVESWRLLGNEEDAEKVKGAIGEGQRTAKEQIIE